MAPRIRALVVDDSAFARKVIRECLSTSPSIEVVGIARTGLEALEKIAELSPDVITLDLVMPDLDGVGVLRSLPAVNPPRVIVVSVSGASSDLGLEALENGAIDLVQKPTSLAHDRLYELRAELVAKVEAAFIARPMMRAPIGTPPPAQMVVPGLYGTRVVVVGTSTGGPQAISRLLAAIPADFSVPLAIAVHIPAEYTAAMARRFDDRCVLEVREASELLELRPGMAMLAHGGNHLRLERRDQAVVARIGREPTATYYPSVDILFQSAVEAYGGRVLGVVLTGMGQDGLEGSRAIRDAGGQVLTESESSAIVYGMPHAVRAAGLASAEAGLDLMLPAILRHL
jgi:two-component system chemotaxis response regulator CheB